MSSVVTRARCGLLFSLYLGAAHLLTVSATQPAGAQTVSAIVEIGPKRSNNPDNDPNAASGGRVNGIAVDPADNRIMYAASEWGGLFKSTDSSRTWVHLNGHVPHATWDIAVDPANSQRLYATSFYDGRVNSIAGINISTDGGVTWSKPPTAVPPEGSCASPEDRDQPHAFGIAIDPEQPTHVFIGTNCGLAASNDSGATWRFIDPSPDDAADYVWDVVVHDGGIIDLCGDDGHQRSINDGASWTTATPGGQPLPSGRCSIAASPDESHVLFAAAGKKFIYDSVDGGQTWPQSYANPKPQGRIPFVATNKRTGAAYDLWFGDVRLNRRRCTTPAPGSPGGTPRCAGSWSADFSTAAGAHNDAGDIAFATTQPDACPLLFSSDGGVYFNTKTTNPACHSPLWRQPDRTPQALWNMDMAGVKDSGTGKVGLYFGNQDTGTFGTTDAGVAEPSWNNPDCCDGFGMAGEKSRVLSTVCCWSPGRQTRLSLSQSGLVGSTPVDQYPAGEEIRGFEQLDTLQNFGPDDYVVLTYDGVFVTTNIAASSIVWTQLGASSSPPDACAVQAAFRGSTPVFHVLSHPADPKTCNGDRGRELWRYEGTGAGGSWKRVTPPGRALGVYAVDPNDPNRIIASDLTSDTPKMVMTTDGGATWSDLTALDALMTGNGTFRYRVARGPSGSVGGRTQLESYPQPTLLAFDPENPDVIVAGAADAGVFISLDSGATWRLLTDPIDPGVSGTPHIPRPRYAFFDHRDGDRLRLFLGTMGRGQWRIELEGVPKAQRQTLTSSLLFDTGSATIKLAAEPELMTVADGIRARADPLVYVDGHTDSVGSEPANQLLSENRANAVKTWLVSGGGIDAGLIRARGFGELRPVATNDTAAGRTANRRVEIVVISNAVAAGARR